MRRALAAALLLCACASTPDASSPEAPTPEASPPEASPPQASPPLTPPASQREEQADYATSLFMDSCVAHITKAADLATWIEERHLPTVEPDLAAKILAGGPGQVWSAAGPLGQFFLIVVPINPTLNQCSVWAHRADAERMTGHFQRLLEGTARSGLGVTVVSDQPIEGPGGTYRQLIYNLVKDGADLGWVFVAVTSASEEAEIQGRLMVAPGKGRQVLAPGSTGTLRPAEPE